MLNFRYNLYSAEKIPEPYIDSWEHTRINLLNGSGMACLGRVFHNYIVGCLNVRDIALELNKGDLIEGPPFNDRCFMVEGICGVPCLDSDANGQQPFNCEGGKIPLDLLISNTSDTYSTGEITAVWASNISWVEWIVILTIFFDCFGNLLRFLPALSGRPTELESARSCICEGAIVIGCASPFVSEDEAILLRSLIGRTITVFHTIGGRHNLQGLYADIILNEKRGKGEETRKMIYFSWIKFITLVGRLGISKESASDGEDSNDNEFCSEGDEKYEDMESSKINNINPLAQSNKQFVSKQSFASNASKGSRSSTGSNKKVFRHQQTTIDTVHTDDKASVRSFGGRSNYSSSAKRKSLVDIQNISYADEIRSSKFDGPENKLKRGTLRLNEDDVVKFQRKTRSSEMGGVPTFKSRDMLARMSVLTPVQEHHGHGESEGSETYVSTAAVNKGGATIVDPFDPNDDLMFDMADLLPLICFLDGWLEALKLKEWTFNYTNKK